MKTINGLESEEPPSKPTPLEQIILNEFVDSTVVIETVRKHSFERTLFPALSKINHYITTNNYELIPNIVGTLLTTINDTLQKVNGKEKESLEYLSGELFKQQIAILNSTERGKDCWQKCISVLKDTCEFKDYNYGELSKLLRFDFIPIIDKPETQNKPLPYYKWHGNDTALLEIIRDIKSKNWIRNVPEFKKLFCPISDPSFTFQAPQEHVDKLVVLFSELKTRELISPQKNRGHFYPLNVYGKDLDGKLFQKEPKKHLEALKKKGLHYTTILKEVHILINSNCV